MNQTFINDILIHIGSAWSHRRDSNPRNPSYKEGTGPLSHDGIIHDTLCLFLTSLKIFIKLLFVPLNQNTSIIPT